VQGLAVRAFQALELEGLARVDFFLERGTGRWFVNEVNTLPGFTEISMYPRLWQASGLSYRDLVTRLIELSVERFERRRGLSVERRLPAGR
jgi:D-alanine-D-alanine ligase